MYQFKGHCDLDLLSRIIVSGVYFYIIRGRNPIFGVWIDFWIPICCRPFLSLCDLDL